MRSMKVDNKYRILIDGERLPVEIDQDVLDDDIARLKDAAYTLQSALRNIYDNDGVTYDIISEMMYKACVDYQEGSVWQVDNLVYELNQIQEQLVASEDILPAYEEAETILDHGFYENWSKLGFYEKTLEDSEECEIVEEIFAYEGEIHYRRRTILWERDGTSKHSKEIIYEDLPIDDNLARVIRNSGI